MQCGWLGHPPMTKDSEIILDMDNANQWNQNLSLSLDCEFLKQPSLLWLYSSQYASHASTIDPPSHVCSPHLVEAGWIVSALQQISVMHNGFHLPLPVDRLQQDSETPKCVRNKFHLPSICDSSAKQVMLQSCEMWWWYVSKLICNVRSLAVWLTARDMWIWMWEVGCSFSREQNVEKKKRIDSLAKSQSSWETAISSEFYWFSFSIM